MKPVNHTLTYPDTTVADVFAMLGDPTYRQAVGEYQHVQDFACDITPAGDGMEVRLEQAHGTSRIPSFAQRLVGHEIRFVQKESWRSPSSAEIHVTIPGKPGEMTGTALLTEDPDGTTETVNLTVKVNIPLVGTKIEGLIADLLVKALRAEHEVGVRYLASGSH